MDSEHNIYKAPEDAIPEEDKARLDGYLAARAEADEKADLEATLREVQAERDYLLEKLERQARRVPVAEPEEESDAR